MFAVLQHQIVKTFINFVSAYTVKNQVPTYIKSLQFLLKTISSYAL